MPRININEIDNTTYSINNLTNDNIVYVPGNMPKGEWKNPVLVSTISQFEKEFGNYSPDGKYGKNTQAAVKRLQKTAAIKEDGIVGIDTVSALLENWK